jgi:signal transduction histidine kinase
MTIDGPKEQRDLASPGWCDHPSDGSEMVRQLAHDLCQPLAAIRALAYATDAEAQAPVLQRLHLIVEQTARLTEIVDDLLAGPGTGPAPARDRTEIHELVRDVVESQRLTYLGCIALHQVSEKACYVPTSATRVRRALANVLANATRAAGAEGSVQLTQRTLDDFEVIEIADSGPGFGQVPLVHGIGLRITEGVLAECGGHMDIERRAPGQTLVRLWLPVVSEPCGGTDSQ